MRPRLTLAILLLATSAVAQTPPAPAPAASAPTIVCPGSPTVAPVVMADATEGFSCVPAPFGTGSTATLRTSSAGAVLWWHCRRPDYTWARNMAVASSEWLLSAQPFADMTSVITAADKTAAMNALVKRNRNTPMASLAAVWCPHWPEIWASVPKNYRVAKNSTSTTRPTYTLTGTTLKSASARATVGAICPSVTQVGKSFYGPFVGSPNPALVALCTKEP
jgi:hypothetical protein